MFILFLALTFSVFYYIMALPNIRKGCKTMKKHIKLLAIILTLMLATLVFTACDIQGYINQFNCQRGIHTLVDVEGKEPTCTEDGYRAHKACECGYAEGKEILRSRHQYESVEGKPATCEEDGYSGYQKCSECGIEKGRNPYSAKGHKYVNGICSCGSVDESYRDYYLVGWINGANHGCEEDYANLGDYKFVDGKLTVKFDRDSYVFIKSANAMGEIVDWLLTESYVTGKEATFIINCTEKMWIPGGVEVSFTLTVNADGTLTLVADYHIHEFASATCQDPEKCECGETRGEVVDHKDDDGDRACDFGCGYTYKAEPQTVVMDNTITTAQTTYFTGGNDAELVGLDPTIFSVVATKGSYGGYAALYYKSTLTAPSQIRLYNHSSSNGNSITVSVAEGYEIVSIKITFAITGRANGYTIVDADGNEIANVATDYEATTLEFSYDVNSGSFTIKNVHTGSSKQVWIDSIEIVYQEK
jgi:hypothetical protein